LRRGYRVRLVVRAFGLPAGSIGRVTDFRRDKKFAQDLPVVQFTGPDGQKKEIVVAPLIASQTDMKFGRVYCQQIPLVPSFAVKAHDLDGHSIDRAVLDLDNSKMKSSPKRFGLAYLMLSRVIDPEGIFFKSFSPGCFEVDSTVLAFENGLRTSRTRPVFSAAVVQIVNSFLSKWADKNQLADEIPANFVPVQTAANKQQRATTTTTTTTVKQPTDEERRKQKKARLAAKQRQEHDSYLRQLRGDSSWEGWEGSAPSTPEGNASRNGELVTESKEQSPIQPSEQSPVEERKAR
jgi:hypothetical protein